MKIALYIISVAFLVFCLRVGFLSDATVQYVSVHSSLEDRPKVTRLLFAGDMMFDRTVRLKAEEKGYDYLFSCITEYLSGFDTVIANLEGPITEYDSQSIGTGPGQANNTTFTFAPAVADALFKHNITLVNAGNNHSLDFGYQGATTTRMYLSHAGVDYFGSPGAAQSTTTTLGGFRISFVNFNQFLGLNDPIRTVNTIQRVRLYSDYVFVYTHWGDEYTVATDYQKELARAFIDAGADMVIGSHPHVLQEHALYKGKHIFYSLGNFIFDQYFSNEVKRGGGVEVTLSPQGEIKIHEQTFDLLHDRRTCLAKEEVS